MTWLTIALVALVGFLVMGSGLLLFTFVRKARRGVRPPTSDPNASSYLNAVFGGAPPTPLPQWAHHDEAFDEDPEGGDSRHGAAG
ncbi:putative secreted protein [Mycobacterium liflandii 128FXT]|uniref:Secreted protein n=1 Tax=Mycobacterium liflandii (strain 128FXT) TaxID=459424 RepID=L7V0Z0_MYCL1|nr:MULTISPECIES: hypothetical protein [Mycobacterium ulcerans group]AGC60188.1 putative secreted protein [Mycobacterium liflandii 128FXT]RFZ55132.1 hypothetical protein BB170200_04021 [Mycobacterium marinum]ULL08859.1 hypothetical protein CKW46_02595 [Mycobacterium liflandii]